MALHFDIHLGATEDAHQAIEQAAHTVALGVQQRLPRQRDESADMAVELVERQCAFAFRRAQLHARDQATEVAPAFLGKRQGEAGRSW